MPPTRSSATLPILALCLLFGVAPSLAQPQAPDTPRGFLGISLEPVSDAVRAALALEEGAGVLVGTVVDGSAAEEAGLESGDVILSIDGRPVRGPRELVATVGGHPPGDTLEMELWRQGQVVRVAVSLMERPESRGGSPQPSRRSGNQAPLGITAVSLTDQLADYFVAPGGILIARIAESSPGEVAGLLAGDVIVSVDDSEIRSPAELHGIVAARREPTVLLGIVRDGNDIFIEAALD